MGKHTLKIQKYGNDGPKHLLAKVMYTTVGKVCIVSPWK